MAAAITKAHPDATVELIEGGGGDFIVICDGKTLWDRNRMGGFPPEREILSRL